MSKEKRGYLPLSEVAHTLSVGRGAVVRQVHAGNLEATRFGRKWLIKVSSLDALLEANRIEPTGIDKPPARRRRKSRILDAEL